MNRCTACSGKFRPITGDGPQPARVLLIGERPGVTENKYNRVFIGKSGDELDETYLPLAGLHRSEVRVCNTVLCWAEGNRTPSDKEAATCSAHHLPGEIARTKPELIILLGGTACKLVPGIKLDTHHGFFQHGRLHSYKGWFLPMYHPALGMHESRWMTHLLEDWGAFRERGVDPTRKVLPVTDYRAANRSEIADYLDCLPGVLSLGVDTEDHGGVPWSVQLSHTPGTARLVRADDREAIAYLAGHAAESSATWIFHHAVHDLDILARFGIHPTRYRDTLQESFHLGNLPQGLKPMVYRLFGYTMTSWEDVVRPYSIEALICWLVEALEISRADLSLIDVKRLKTKIRETVKKGPLEQLIARLLVHTTSDSDYDPWERLDEFWTNDAHEWMTSHIEARIGRYPIQGIANAPFKKALVYACSDADWTGQAADELARRRADSYLQIAREDRDQ